jgi:hypothetical protein
MQVVLPIWQLVVAAAFGVGAASAALRLEAPGFGSAVFAGVVSWGAITGLVRARGEHNASSGERWTDGDEVSRTCSRVSPGRRASLGGSLSRRPTLHTRAMPSRDGAVAYVKAGCAKPL